MSSALSENAVAIIARSRPLMERHRERLHGAMGRYMAARGSHDQAWGRDEAAARLIMDGLLDRAQRVAQSAPDWRKGGRRASGLSDSDYARFGDGLWAVMRDVLGDEASPALLSAWGDLYWAMIRAGPREPLPLAA